MSGVSQWVRRNMGRWHNARNTGRALLLLIVLSRRFLDAVVREAGEDRVSMDVLEGAEHGDPAFGTDQNMKRVQEFLDQYLK